MLYDVHHVNDTAIGECESNSEPHNLTNSWSVPLDQKVFERINPTLNTWLNPFVPWHLAHTLIQGILNPGSDPSIPYTTSHVGDPEQAIYFVRRLTFVI